jgi:hypothetical protein
LLPTSLRLTLKLEWALLAAGLALAFAATGGSWLLFALLVLAPDLSMLGYLAGPRIGALSYNLFHSLIGSLALPALGWFGASDPAVHVAVIWAFHVAVDRALGYGLKLPTSFRDTHLGQIGRD